MFRIPGKSEGSKDSGLRDVIRDVLNEDGRREKLAELVDSAFELKRLATVYCPSCKRRLQAEVPDLKGTVDVLISLLEQASGRPGTAAGEDAGLTLVVERRWPSPDLPSAA